MSLLIGSVYADHPRSRAWYKIQMDFLNKTTSDFVHCIYLNGKENFYEKSIVIESDENKLTGKYAGRLSHVRGLNRIIEYFDEDKFDSLLLLDSDCFPICPWKNSLLKNMDGFEVAAPIRFENLDSFAHPCAFFAKKKIVKNLRFALNQHTNLAGKVFEETSSNATSFFPLIRSNRVNYHQLLFGIYSNCFYHHGGGTRNLKFRIDGYIPPGKNLNVFEKECFQRLKNDPESFLEELSFKLNKRKFLC